MVKILHKGKVGQLPLGGKWSGVLEEVVLLWGRLGGSSSGGGGGGLGGGLPCPSQINPW